MTDRIDTGDGEVVWTRHGEGPPLLLVNGYAATGADWDPCSSPGLPRPSCDLPGQPGYGRLGPARGR